MIDARLHFVETIDEVVQLRDWMAVPRPYIAVDTETQGLQWWRHQPRLLQIGDANEAWAIPWHLWGGAILEVLRNYTGDIVMHNMPFDIMMFETWSGVKLPKHRMHDTRIQSHVLEPHKPTGLKPVAERWVDRRAAQSQRVLKEAMELNNWGWDTVPLDFQPYWVYACMDTILTSRVHEHHLPIIQRQCPQAYQLELATGHVLIDMMYRGVQVDEEYTNEKLKDFEKYVDDTYDWIEASYGVKAGSNDKVVNRLMRDIPESVYQFTELTPTGNYKLDRDVLLDVIAATNHPLAVQVLQRRRVQRVCKAYLSKFTDLAVNGRIHPSFNPVIRKNNDESDEGGYGAKTGRMSVADPPLQQLPRKDNDNPVANVVRNCITATPGNTLIMCDFDQVEMRAYAHLCRDPNLLRAFDEGDLFVNMAREIYQDWTIEKKDPRRQPTKNGGYAKIYGSGTARFATTVGVSEEQAAAFMFRLDSLYPGMQAYNDTVVALAEEREKLDGVAWVESPLTSRRYYNDDGRHYALINYMVQGMAAEILKMKVLELYKAGLGKHLVLLVHDEVILDVPKEDAEEASHLVQDTMQDLTSFAVPLTAGLDMAERWGGK